jgi:hypothetical protein
LRIKEWKVERVDALKLSRASGIPIDKFAGGMIGAEQAKETKMAIFRNWVTNPTPEGQAANLAQSAMKTRRAPLIGDSAARSKEQRTRTPSARVCGFVGPN